MNTVIHLQKEDILSIKFPKIDVLTNSVEIKLRERDLERACFLGNSEHTKVKITFADAEMSLYEIETTVWAITEDGLCLKGHLYLPKRAIIALS
ncbi:hypothetical protein [Pararhodonellum marinum]|uniref:hypothetical protein n=1 Tax=Pararhodonellum marinum TaxID=2755358 RepID=UPI001890746A|nr:hypothetical protein [Pararhodonellum marinum]